jgi:nucleoside-diphosphate-sugar epimerase
MQKIICLIGGTGFVGQHLLTLLLTDLTITEIRVLTRQGVPSIAHERIKYIQGDLRDPKCLENFILPNAIVINLAYLADKQKQNVNIMHHLAMVCLNLRAAYLIHLSTAVVVGEVSDTIIQEEIKCHPLSDYEKIKYEIEKPLN